MLTPAEAVAFCRRLKETQPKGHAEYSSTRLWLKAVEKHRRVLAEAAPTLLALVESWAPVIESALALGVSVEAADTRRLLLELDRLQEAKKAGG